MSEHGKGSPKPQEHSPLLSRRQFLEVTAGGTLAIVATAAGYELLREKRTTNQIETDEGIAKLHEYVGELADSPLKQDLEKYVLPIFSNPAPDSIETSEGNIPIKSRAITHELVFGNPNDPTEYNGTLKVIGDISGGTNRSPNDQDMKLPLPYFLSVNEEASYPREKLGGNGTLIVDVAISKDAVLDAAISPIIEIKLLDPKTHGVDEKTFRKIEKMIYLKEALGLLYYLKYHEKVVSQIKSLGLESTLPAVDENGNNINIDTATALLAAADRNSGRYLALLDLAGYYLMFSVLNNTNEEELLRRDPNFSDALDSIDDFKQEGAGDVYEQATIWALTSPVVNKLAHSGDLNKIP